MPSLLKITDLHVSVDETPILRGVNLEVRQGEIHALMGPNGSGKSTLAYTLVGHPKYEITEGSIEIDGVDLADLDPSERARLGLFLAFQYPITIPGVKVAAFLRHAITNVRNPGRKEGKTMPMRGSGNPRHDERTQHRRRVRPPVPQQGASPAAKKRMEILRSRCSSRSSPYSMRPTAASTDAVRVVSEGLRKLSGPHMGVLIITHHERLLEFNQPHFTHVMLAGRIVESADGGGLAHDVHANGYAAIRERHPVEAAEEQAAAKDKEPATV